MKLKIKDFEDKETKAEKPYTRFKTNEGWMSCFDKKECDKIKKLVGTEVELELKESGNFKNIVKIVEEQSTKEVPRSALTISKTRTMYTSYAKDIFLRLMDEKEMSFDERMDKAVELVKRARNAF